MAGQRQEPATKRDLDQLKQELVGKIDVNGAKIDQVEENLSAKINANNVKIEANGAKVDANAVKIEANGKKIDANSATLAKVVRQVVENRELIEQKVSRDEFNKRMDDLVTGQDKMMTILTRLDQERIVTSA